MIKKEADGMVKCHLPFVCVLWAKTYTSVLAHS
ncbi:hypothetical protein SAMN05216390_10649 [Lachnospiraceae bacterium KH1T2]|nr:hypothetical protein SAMN05216390_10649 [Lachnospiraceae bacterium KH1T2]